VIGEITDKYTKKSMQDVSVSVIQKGKIINGMLTDKKGKFYLELESGSYVLQINFMGYKSVKMNFTLTNTQNKYDFGVIYLEEDISQLDEVEIQAEKTSITEKIDKKVIHIGKDLTTSGASALNVLDNLPAVSVDNGKVTYRGNANVMIYIDGKPTTIQAENILDQIPANTIKDVELISNPSARYNPEGIGGIINIILRKNTNLGFHANVATGTTIGNLISTNSSLNMNFKKGKINVFTNLGFINKNKKSGGLFDYNFNNITEKFTTLLSKESFLAKVGFDYQINKKNTFSFYTYQNFISIDKNKETKVNENGPTFKTTVDEKFNDRVKIYNLNYKIDFNDKGHKLEFEVNFDNNIIEQNNQNIDFSDLSSDFNYKDKIDIERKYTIFNIDYQNTLKNEMNIEVGTEYRMHRVDNKKQTNQINLDPNSLFEYNKDEYSFYTTIADKITEKLSYKLGSRIEYYTYETELNSSPVFSKNYTTLYPSLHLSYELDKKNYFKAGYSKHIFRPDIDQVNPTNLWSSYTMTIVGNPKLKPTFVDYFELYYRLKLKKGAIILNPFYQVNYNSIYQSISQDPLDPDRLILSYDNSDVRKQYTLEYYFYYKINNWWLIAFDGFASVLNETGIQNNQNIEFSYNSLNTSLQQKFTINPNFNILISAKYISKTKTIQLEKAAIGKIDIAARYSFFKGKLNTSIRLNDILDTMGYSYVINGPLSQNGKINIDTQSVYFSLSYSFGGKAIANRSRKQHEKQEINGGGDF
jgi:outer membrane receptor protein involved in Fe transport